MMHLGSTDLDLSPLTLGTWAFAGGGLWGPQEEKESIAAVHAALDGGITAFDTAPAYGSGESERILGKALRGRRDKALVATKVSEKKLGYSAVMASCDDSLKRLQTDRIDLLQAHWSNPEIPVEETVSAFLDLQSQGKIRHAAVCNFGPKDLHAWLDAGGEMVSNQLPYSLLWRAIEFDILPECERHGISILPYSPLMQGLLTGKFKSPEDVPAGRARSRHFSTEREKARHGEPGCEGETFEAIRRISGVAQRLEIPMAELALAWLLGKPSVPSVIVGVRNPEQVKRNLGVLERSLPESVIEELDTITDGVKQRLGSNPDLWESPGRYH